MTITTDADIQALVGPSFRALADALDRRGPQIATAPSLCEGWTVGHVLAHMTMAARYDAARFGAELAAAHYDFDVLSNTVADRDATLPFPQLLDDLRSTIMATWVPPGGGATGALTHVVIHGLDITTANGLERTADDAATSAVLTALTEDGSAGHFGIHPRGLRFRATDVDWSYGTGTLVEAPAGDLILALAGRSRPNVLRLR